MADSFLAENIHNRLAKARHDFITGEVSGPLLQSHMRLMLHGAIQSLVAMNERDTAKTLRDIAEISGLTNA